MNNFSENDLTPSQLMNVFSENNSVPLTINLRYTSWSCCVIPFNHSQIFISNSDTKSLQIWNITWIPKILNFDFQFLLPNGIVIHTSKCIWQRKVWFFSLVCNWNETRFLQFHLNLCFSLVIVITFVMGSTILRGLSYLFWHFWKGLKI